MKMNKSVVITSALLLLTAVIFGATGSHFVKSQFGASAHNTFDTGVRYQFYHGLALLIISTYFSSQQSSWMIWSQRLMILGILLFSGSLYLLALRPILGIESASVLGPITPIGGVFLILAWLSFLVGVKKIKL